MGGSDFENLSVPQMFSFEFLIDSIMIYEGEHQNVDTANRYVVLDEENNVLYDSRVPERLAKEGKAKKSKGKGKGKNKHKHKDHSAKKKVPEKPIIEVESHKEIRKQIFLPPFRIGVQYFFNKMVKVEQVDLPSLFSEDQNNSSNPNESKPIDYLAFDKAKKKNKKGAKGKKKGKKVIKKKQEVVKPPVMQPVSPIQWATDEAYSAEELSWRLPSEQGFKRGICVTFSATAEQMILWLQRGPFHVEVSRWKGYGPEIPVGTATISFDSDPFIKTVLKRSSTMNMSTMSYRAQDISVIFDENLERIGEMSISFYMLCNGGTVISEYLVSEKGVYEFLSNLVSEKEVVVCNSCGKYGNNYNYQLMEDMSLAIVPNAITFDNLPVITSDFYQECIAKLEKPATSSKATLIAHESFLF